MSYILEYKHMNEWATLLLHVDIDVIKKEETLAEKMKRSPDERHT